MGRIVRSGPERSQRMGQLLVKALVSGVIIAIASEVARRSPVIGAIIVSLPIISILTLAWLYRDTGSAQKVQDLSWSILLLIVPSLVFFVAVPVLIRSGTGVPLAILGACGVTALVYLVYVLAGRRLGLDV